MDYAAIILRIMVVKRIENYSVENLSSTMHNMALIY